MMRLIDADLFEVVAATAPSEDFIDGMMYILEMIDNAPTIYDVDKVLKEITNVFKKSKFCDYCCPPPGYVECDNYKTCDECREACIYEIIKRGGVYE